MEALSYFLGRIFIGVITVGFAFCAFILLVLIASMTSRSNRSGKTGDDRDIVQALRECASDNPKGVWTKYWQTGKFESRPKRRHQLEQSVVSSTGGMSGKIPNLTNVASAILHKEAREMQFADEQHDANDTKFSASTPAAGYELGGHQVIDDFAALRRRNAEHEKHLQARIKGWD